MRIKDVKVACLRHFTMKRISRSLSAILVVTVLQMVMPSQIPAAFASAGNVGTTTASGTCASAVGETSYVTATFEVNTFCLLKFTTGTTWTVPTGVTSIDILVVGGGGGGGTDGGGGGGGGEVRQATGVSVSGGVSGTATVGLGGAGGYWVSPGSSSYSGGTSSFVINGTTYSAGGGAGGVGWQAASNNAIRGSGGSNGAALTGGTSYSYGGTNSSQTSGYTTGFGGVGFDGVSTSFTGTSVSFAGGGGGGICTNNVSDPNFGGLAGGAGGGGRGALHTYNVGSDAGQPGANGLGGGGGGGAACNDGGVNGTNARTAGGRGGNGVVYVKYIPAISITSNPSNSTGVLGTTATFTASNLGTISGATRTKKWQILVPSGAWTDIPNSDGDSYTTPTITRDMNGNQYRYVVTDSAGTLVSSSTSSAASLTVTAPYLLGDTDTALTTSSTKYASASNSNSLIPGTVSTISLEAWIKPSSTCDGAVACTIMTIDKSFLVQVVSGKIRYYIGSGTAYCDGGVGKDVSGAPTPGGQWTHVGFVRVNANVKIYINGTLRSDITSSCSPTTQAANTNAFVIGAKGLNSEPFVGSVDEVRIWNVDRTSNVASDMHSNETYTSGLLHYWNFNEGTGTVAYDQIPGATSTGDLTVTDSTAWDSTAVSDINTSTAYSIRTFYRTYITAKGGWTVPSNASSISALLVGGGGGGGYNTGGGGSGGGFYAIDKTVISGRVTVTVGVGGRGASGTSSSPTLTSTNGGATSFGAVLTVNGGNAGAVFNASGGTGGASVSGSGRGGSGATVTNGESGFAGPQSSITGTLTSYSGGGGGGAASSGGTIANGALGGAGGAGGGGNGEGKSASAVSGTANTGGGGGGSAAYTTAGNGGSGVVILRWITATKPIFTQPTIDTTTAGLTDTITVSANPISPLTRNYLWQASSDTGTTWANISTGSGFTSQTYTTPTLETATSGIRYQYRVVVTDSDTAGLFITDTSTAVYIVINPRIGISGSYTVQKYGATHVDTFTTVAGTGTGSETFTFSPNNRSGITWNGSTPNQATLTIARTLGPGTYYETMTATDTKGATTQLGVAIVVSKADTITVTSLARSDTYTSNALTFTPGYTVTGLQNSDTVTSISWSYSGTENSLSAYGPSATKPLNAGSYLITPAAVITNVDSYTALVYETSTLTVNRATRTITASVSPSPLKFGATGALSATPSGGSGDGVVTYSTSTTDSCTVTSANVQAIKSSGSCGITAKIARGNNYESATATTVTIPLAKADTLTVSVNAITPVTYTGNPAAISPTVTVTGLALTNSVGSSPATITYVAQGVTGSACAQGGACAIGDTGPGGGIVFYDAGSQQFWGRYLEAAPANWSGGTDNQASNISKWCEATSSVDGTTFTGLYNGFGYGYINTYDTRLNVCTGGAIYKARAYRGGGYTNWYLPNATELAVMASSSIRTLIGLVNDASKWGYWGSNEDQSSGFIGSLVTSSWGIGATVKGESGKNYTRPIHAFSQGEVATTTYSAPPTDAGSYTVKAASLTFSSGSLSDYQGVTYTDGTLLINRAQQSPLAIAQYAAFFGTPYKILIFGGSGTGALTETVTAGTALGCTINGDTLTSTTVGTCQLFASKAQDRNYETATAVAFVYFLNYVINQPVSSSGSSSEIALSGVTAVTVDSNSPPSITGFSALTLSLTGGGTFTITGTGFTGSITVKFWRNKSISATSGNGTTIVIPVSSIQSAGVTSGRIGVITASGEAVSVDSLTITP
jgi:hypothetical protein